MAVACREAIVSLPVIENFPMIQYYKKREVVNFTNLYCFFR